MDITIKIGNMQEVGGGTHLLIWGDTGKNGHTGSGTAYLNSLWLHESFREQIGFHLRFEWGVYFIVADREKETVPSHRTQIEEWSLDGVSFFFLYSGILSLCASAADSRVYDGV